MRAIAMGLGRHGGGVAVARWMAEQGCRVTVTDLADEAQLADSLAQLADVPIAKYALGGHDERDFRRADIVAVNPAVRRDHPLLALARESGAKLTSEAELFLDRCPATVVGVTGTTGKSTTCAMLAEICRYGGRCTWLGGNIGHSLLDELKYMQPYDLVVLELSSFQLAHFSRDVKLPRIAAVTNCSPNHLNWHGDWIDYVRSKLRLLAGGDDQRVVLNLFDREVVGWKELVEHRCLPSVDESVLPELVVPGRHNRQNAIVAATVARHLRIDDHAIRRGLASFVGLPHRQQFVGNLAGRRFYNDSKATSPAATLAALDAIPGPIWLLAGGVDSGQDWTTLASAIHNQAKGVILFGAARGTLLSAMQGLGRNVRAAKVETLAEALALAFEFSQPGDAILLSPGCPSFDQFADFAERGRMFEELVHALSASQPEGSNRRP